MKKTTTFHTHSIIIILSVLAVILILGLFKILNGAQVECLLTAMIGIVAFMFGHGNNKKNERKNF